MNDKKYNESHKAFIEMDGYKDSADKASSICDKNKSEKLKVVEVGDCVFFGSYEQDNDTSKGKEDIEWLVLDKQEDRILVISKYALDCKPYNTDYTSVTWETCTLRSWLNNDFIDSAFSDDEKGMIPTVTVSADKNPEYSTNPGNATQDKVFLLSITEADEYFSSDSARQCKPTDYAVTCGADVNSDNGSCWWWLRSPGNTQDVAADVHSGGYVDEGGGYVDMGGHAVRPALWIDLNLMTGLHVKKQDDLAEQAEPFDNIDPKTVDIGDYVFFGSYEQDNDTSNGKEDIEWLVLDKQEDKILVISKYALDCKPYNTKRTSVTWKTCTLRSWLNNDFINSAFSDEEKAMIPTVTVSADKNPEYSTNPGNATQDKVFLLSFTKVIRYLSSNSARQCKPTDYAVARGAKVDRYSGNCCCWWLRSPGEHQWDAAFVYYDGGISEYGKFVFSSDVAVRPALWIDLNLMKELHVKKTRIKKAPTGSSEIVRTDLKAAEIGDYVFFGSYEQDNDTSNGKEDIKWLVLDKQEDKILVISKYALDCKQYDTKYAPHTWETCTLRSWLNNEFIDSAFSDEEKAMIPTVTVSANKKTKYSTNPGNETQDKVFLLSITEAKKYFGSDRVRQCKPTDFAVERRAKVNSDNGNCWWWLRSPGGEQGNAATVISNGDVYKGGDNVHESGYAVRPALWIELNS